MKKLEGKIAVVTVHPRASVPRSPHIWQPKVQPWLSTTHLAKKGANRVVDEIVSNGGKAIAQ